MRLGDGRLVKVIGSVFGDFITAVERLDPAGHARVICKVMHMGMLRLRHIHPYRTMVLIARRARSEWRDSRRARRRRERVGQSACGGEEGLAARWSFLKARRQG